MNGHQLKLSLAEVLFKKLSQKQVKGVGAGGSASPVASLMVVKLDNLKRIVKLALVAIEVKAGNEVHLLKLVMKLPLKQGVPQRHITPLNSPSLEEHGHNEDYSLFSNLVHQRGRSTPTSFPTLSKKRATPHKGMCCKSGKKSLAMQKMPA